MKRFLFCLIALFYYPAFISGQPLGVIKVNENYSATCEFSSDVKNIYISNNELIETISNNEGKQETRVRLYDYVIDGRIVIFSTFKSLPAKSVTIRLSDGSTWYGILEYDKDTKQIYYPYKSNKIIATKESASLDSTTRIRARLNHCISAKNGFQPFGINKNRIYWEISNIMADGQYTYIKILVNNRSGHMYEINNGKALFEYREGKSRNLNKKEASVKMDGFVIYQEGKQKINAYSTEILGYVIQSYPLNNTGKLYINFLESNGKRNYEIKIPFKYLEKVEVFSE